MNIGETRRFDPWEVLADSPIIGKNWHRSAFDYTFLGLAGKIGQHTMGRFAVRFRDPRQVSLHFKTIDGLPDVSEIPKKPKKPRGEVEVRIRICRGSDGGWEPIDGRRAVAEEAFKEQEYLREHAHRVSSAKGGKLRKKHPAFLQYLREFLEGKLDGTLDQAWNDLPSAAEDSIFIVSDGLDFDVYRDGRQIVAVERTRGKNENKTTSCTKRSLEPYWTTVRKEKSRTSYRRPAKSH